MRRLLVIVASLAAMSASAATLDWVGDFEEGSASIAGSSTSDFSKHIYDEGKAATVDVQSASGMSICTAPRAGKYAGRARILSGGSNLRVRAELIAHQPGKYNFAWDGPEYWLGYSFCLAQWPKGSDVHSFLQVHAPNEIKGATCDFAGNALSIVVVNDVAQVRVIDNPSGISDGQGAFANNKTVYSFPLRTTMGKWQDFAFKFRLSTQGTGYFGVWHNGKLVASGSGITNVNWRDSCGNPIDRRSSNGPHVGMYGGKNSAGPKTLYMDQVRIAVGSSGLGLVAPWVP